MHQCIICPDLNLCQTCFKGGAHSQHAFRNRASRLSRWTNSTRSVPALIPDSLVRDLEMRDLTDQDYEQLLNLDNAQIQGAIPLHVVNSFPVTKIKSMWDILGAASGGQKKCQVCMVQFTFGDLVRRIPCGHGFHQPCIDKWLINQRCTCPICGLAAYSAIGGAEEQQAGAAEMAIYTATPAVVQDNHARKKRRDKKANVVKKLIVDPFEQLVITGNIPSRPSLQMQSTPKTLITQFRRHGIRLTPLKSSRTMHVAAAAEELSISNSNFGRQATCHQETVRHVGTLLGNRYRPLVPISPPVSSGLGDLLATQPVVLSARK